jgi:cytochrome bd-type quinol oxidase subunit 2
MNTVSLFWGVLFALIVRSSGFRFRSAAELRAMAVPTAN